jgi:predicted secreted protein
MGQAAYEKKIKVSADNGATWEELPATSPSLELAGDVLDDTDLKNNAGFRKRILGLSDFSCSADSNWSAGDAGLAIVRNAKLNRTTIKVAYLPDGVDGFMGNVVVETYNMAGEVGGLETVSISLQGNGPLEDFA